MGGNNQRGVDDKRGANAGSQRQLANCFTGGGRGRGVQEVLNLSSNQLEKLNLAFTPADGNWG